MESLRFERIPVKLDQPILEPTLNVKKKEELTPGNSDQIMSLYSLMGLESVYTPIEQEKEEEEEEEEKEERNMTISSAEKTNIYIKLEQHEGFRIDLNNEEVKSNEEQEISKAKASTKASTKKKALVLGKGILNNSDIPDELKKYSFYYDNLNDDFDSSNKTYFTPDKNGFLSDIRMKLEKYLNEHKKRYGDEVKGDSCDITNKESGFNPLIHQRLVKQYLNSTSPYRGLLLFHGLGSGKTCTSIGIIEAMKQKKTKIFVLTPASLAQNYKTQMKFCGNHMFRENSNWVFVPFPQDKTKDKFIDDVCKLTGLTKKYFKDKNGVYLISKENENSSNKDIIEVQNKELNEQIEAMIEARFHFISYNGITTSRWLNYYCKDKENPFDHSTVIIDEGHNFVSRIFNKLNTGNTSVSTMIYKSLVNSQNCNVVVLSGTPLINYPSELGVLFNIVRGANALLKIYIDHKKKSKLSIDVLRKIIESKVSLIDFIDKKEEDGKFVLIILKNPYGFVVKKDKGIVSDFNKGNITNEQLLKEIIDLLNNNDYKVDNKNTKIDYIYPFPDTQQLFNNKFNDNEVKLQDLYFKKKILGLVSFIGDKKELMPEMIIPEDKDFESHPHYKNEQIFIEFVKMNEHVLKGYSKARSMEYEQEKMNRRNAKKDEKSMNDKQTSSYKIFSRAACNFVFPESLQRPYLLKTGSKNSMTEDDLEVLSNDEKLNMNDGTYDTTDILKETTDQKIKNAKQKYAKKIQDVLLEFKNNPHNYFQSNLKPLYKHEHFTEMGKKISTDTTINPKNKLEYYSPKYLSILEKLMNPEYDGLHLLYSQFRTLEGIGIFKIVLDYYGYTELKITKDTSKSTPSYKLVFEQPYYLNKSFYDNPDKTVTGDYITSLIGRKFYSLYTGKESEYEKEMIRNIYNGQLDKLPYLLRKEVIKYFYEDDENNVPSSPNADGELIQLLMITSSGAEGIDLKNVRYVHIMEPYWHPVRLDQVIGRARRICSHKDLPPEKQNVQVFLYLMVYDNELMETEKIKELYIQLIEGDSYSSNGITEMITTDENLYRISTKKREKINRYHDALISTSIDCMINFDDKKKCFIIDPKLKKNNRLTNIVGNDKKTIIIKK